MQHSYNSDPAAAKLLHVHMWDFGLFVPLKRHVCALQFSCPTPLCSVRLILQIHDAVWRYGIDSCYVIAHRRCVLARNGTPVVMTVDHKPDDPKEAERIQGAGGFVLWGRVGGNLNLSRAVGDSEFKKNTELPKAMQMVSEPHAA